jgi:hypothetical protein
VISSFLKNNLHSFKFQKIMRTNLVIVNDVTFKDAISYKDVFVIVCYTKITKSDKICRFRNIHTQIYRCLSFLCSSKYKVFKHDFMHVCGINS